MSMRMLHGVPGEFTYTVGLHERSRTPTLPCVNIMPYIISSFKLKRQTWLQEDEEAGVLDALG